MSQLNFLCLSAVSVTATHCETPTAPSGTWRRPYINVTETSPYSGCVVRCSAATASRSAFAPPEPAPAAADAGTATTKLVPRFELTSNTSTPGSVPTKDPSGPVTSPAFAFAFAFGRRRVVAVRRSE